MRYDESTYNHPQLSKLALYLRWLESEVGNGLEECGSLIGSLEALNKISNGMSIKQVFEKNCPNLVGDKALYKELRAFDNRFVTKNQDHIDFFGGNLIGVHPIKFTVADRNDWFDTIMDTDEAVLTEELHGTSMVNPNFHVTGDAFNLCMPYVLHVLHHSKELSPHEIEAAKIHVVNIFHYRNLSSILSHDYRYPAQESIAKETYKQLSKKFDLKVYGTWSKLINARSKSIINRSTGIHYNTYVKMNDDKAIIYMVGDVQDRLRDVINSINRVFHQVKLKQSLVFDASNTVELDGVTMVRDVEKTTTKYIRYINDIAGVRTDWIKPTLVDVAANSINTIPRKPFEETLIYMSRNYGKSKDEKIGLLLDKTLIHLFSYMKTKRLRLTDVPDVVAKMRGAYTSNRSTNEDVLEMRKLGEEIARSATNIKVETQLAAIRTGVLIYIVLRSLSMGSYT